MKKAKTKPPTKKAVDMKRLTLDLPEALHRRIKAQCAMRGQKIVDVLRAILAREFPPK